MSDKDDEKTAPEVVKETTEKAVEDASSPVIPATEEHTHDDEPVVHSLTADDVKEIARGVVEEVLGERTPETPIADTVEEPEVSPVKKPWTHRW